MKSLKDNFNIDSEKLFIVIEGDRKLDVFLVKIGGKGFFVKDIEIVFLDERVSVVVYSMKDVFYELSEEFEIIVIIEREDIRDVFILKDNILFKELKKGVKIGISSIRRVV